MTSGAKLSVGGPVGLLLMAPIVVLDGWLLNLINKGIRAEQISFVTFIMGLIVLLGVPVLLFLAYQTVSCLSLRYRLDRNGIVVRWFGTERIIPIRDIQQIVSGYQLGGAIVQRRGLHWLGHERGSGMVPGIGRTRFLATQPLTGQLLLVTPGLAYGISPSDAEEFLKGFESRRELGPNRLLEQGVHRAGWLTWPFWLDQTAWVLLGAAVIINLGLIGYLCARFPGLDYQLPLHFNSLGEGEDIRSKIELFRLPIIGLIILGTNLGLGLILYRWERAGSYLLWGAAAAVQALFWLAAFSIVP